MKEQGRFAPRLALTLIVGCAALQAACAGETADRQGVNTGSGFSAGIDLRSQASAADIGLPIYAGAVPQRDKDDDSPAVTLGLWGGSFGFKVVALKLASPDRLETVADFYRTAMARLGTVLDCSQPHAAREAQADSDKKPLRCGDDKPEAGGRLYKVGTAHSYRSVSLEPMGSGVKFQLVRIETKGD